MTALLPWLCGPVQPLNQPQLPREQTAVTAVRRLELIIHIIKLFQTCALCYGLGETSRHNISKFSRPWPGSNLRAPVSHMNDTSALPTELTRLDLIIKAALKMTNLSIFLKLLYIVSEMLLVSCK